MFGFVFFVFITLHCLLILKIVFSGTVGILFSLLSGPTYIAADGSSRILYATISGILARSITGNHASPISDTTILTCVACDYGLFEHVKTQFPYVLTVAFWSIIFGTLPVGYSDKFPSVVLLLLGASAVAKDGRIRHSFQKWNFGGCSWIA